MPLTDARPVRTGLLVVAALVAVGVAVVSASLVMAASLRVPQAPAATRVRVVRTVMGRMVCLLSRRRTAGRGIDRRAPKKRSHRRSAHLCNLRAACGAAR